MKKKIILAFAILLIMSIAADLSTRGNLENGYIDRNPIGGEEKKLDLQLEVENLIEDYAYSLEVVPQLPEKEDAETYFQEARAQIDRDFADIETRVPIAESYANGYVQAEWTFYPYGIVGEQGDISFDRIEEETIVRAQAELLCGTYERLYTFSFVLSPPTLSKEEQVLQEIEDWFAEQMKTEGSQKIKLPTEIDGKQVTWFEEREWITPKVLCLEVLALLLLKFAYDRKQKEENEKRIQEMEREYPEVVNQLSLLLGAGMTIRQAWMRMADQYEYKRKAGFIERNRVYDAIVQMQYRLRQGESESVVYRGFVEDISTPSYRKLVRLLLGNLEKGTAGIAVRLEEESRQAYEERLLRAKKMGEEASTKMLLPLMLMLTLVMGVVLVPALMKFQI